MMRPRLQHLLVLAALGGVAACGDESVLVPPPVEAGLASVSAGLLHTCGLTVTSHLYCWGWNKDGEIGDGSTTDRVYPVRILGDVAFRSVAAGGGHSCAVTLGGTPYCWGLNLTGQLGDATVASKSTPTAVVGGLTLGAVATGATFTCGLVAADSTAYCWGWARDGELGSRPATLCGTPTGPEPCSTRPVIVSGGPRFVTIHAGTRHTCGLAADSTAYCWGHNDAGQLGNGATADTAQPVAVSGGIKFARLALGFSHSCGVTGAGDAYCWGDNTLGQLGAPTVTQSSVPVRVVGAVIFVQLSAGSEHTCGIANGDAAWCWGLNLNSELGAESSETCTTENITSPCSRRPLLVTTNQSFASISAGGHHTCAVTPGGKAYCWGNNSNGQLGTGNQSGSTVPVPVANQP